MKMFKKIVALVLAVLCLALCVACKDSSDKSGEGDSSVKLFVTYNDVTIKLGAKADGIIEALGEPQSRTEIGDCGGLGAQVKYTYPSIEVYVLESKTDGNIIDQITLRDDIVTTPEGVYIGLTKSEAEGLLGAPTSSSDKAMLYTSGKYTLKLTLDGNTVSEINYITNSN